MTIVSDTSPLCYLVLIGQAGVLPNLYGGVHTTRTVMDELRHAEAPPLVRAWAGSPPDWLEIHPDLADPDPLLNMLDRGKRTALRLAERLRADVILLDEAAARG
ncbi:MAG: hypothetical protein H7A46_25155 [Verrucomicrobiales bacterium]|nr:hypothetical protein [Verrucomicrobiales bacterium]